MYLRKCKKKKKKNHGTERGEGIVRSEKQQMEHQGQRSEGGAPGAGAEFPLQRAPAGDHGGEGVSLQHTRAGS